MNIENVLLKYQNQDYKLFQSKICQTKYPIKGVKIPILRKISKFLLKNNSFEEVIHSLDDSSYEMVMLEGLVIGECELPLKERLKYIDNFLPKIDNWAICDIFVSSCKFTNDNKKEMLKYIKKLLKDDREYYLRVGIVFLKTYYIDDLDYQMVLDLLLNIKSDYYYVKMAIAWTLSAVLVKYYDETINYLITNKYNLDKWTYNKTLQKGRESFQINKEQKKYLQNLKY